MTSAKKNLPRYVRTLSHPDEQGIRRPEWLVRGISEETNNEHGERVKTPEDLLNRYYRCDGHIPMHLSAINSAPQPCFFRYEQIEKEDPSIEY